MAGPTVQQELFDIILRFRQHRFVLTGDIIKMYRQILLNPDQRKLQCILLRKTPDHPRETFQLDTVTFGIASSPYLATRCLNQLARDSESTWPLASRIIREDFYVDDLLTGAQTEEEINEIRKDVTAILKSAGFELQKSYSNISNFDCGDEEQEITEIKTLRLRWKPKGDQLTYHTTYDSNSKVFTKRTLLSAIAQIFDPLGLLGPLTVRSKILLQHLWKLKVGWDSPIPIELTEGWNQYCKQLQEINRIEIPRHVLCSKPISIQIHGFSDASEAAYGACIYMRSTENDGTVKSRLLCARSRIAPIKSVSLPRLELCGAVLLANLYAKVTEALTINVEDAYFWSDSSITLAWIRGDAARWHTFVGNRTAEIQQLTSVERWRHVASEQNPADLISRGMTSTELKSSGLWWNGPAWLQEEADAWPQDMNTLEEVPESKKVTLNFVAMEKDFSIFSRFSSWNKLLRVTAYCYRFKENLQRKVKKEPIISETLSADELSKAELILIKLHQQEVFQKELVDLRQNKSVNFKSRLAPLNPFQDQEGLLRVGGRLNNAPLSYSQRFPIILAPNHVLTELLVRDSHYKNLHAGTSLLIASLRERVKPVSPTQLMGALPPERVTPSRIFAHTGLDYAGPFNVKISRNKTGKAYICVFVCMAIKAVHLELVPDLTTNGFLNALKRFIARRGKCISLSSDNGKNFVGANNELQKIVNSLFVESGSRSKILDFVAKNSIKWNFIPPHSPHMGGLWEAAVKSAKSHLKKVINNTPLTFEEFYTVLTQIESILNSRPLCPLSSDVEDLSFLTPGHFLIGTALNSVLEENVREIPINRLSRFQLLSQMQQSFWQRWSTEYVTQLQSRSKWKKVQSNDCLRVGQMIIVKDDNLPPLRWQLGRIIELHPGADNNLVRIVSIKTSTGVLKRSLPKICILPIETER